MMSTAAVAGVTQAAADAAAAKAGSGTSGSTTSSTAKSDTTEAKDKEKEKAVAAVVVPNNTAGIGNQTQKPNPVTVSQPKGQSLQCS